MALDKAIKSGKEHRKPYRGSKAIDGTCRNHGSCPWCKENRQHKFRDKQADELKEWRDDDGSSTVVYSGCACLDCLSAVANGGMTMDDLISRKAVRLALSEVDMPKGVIETEFYDVMSNVADRLIAVPSVDAAPVKHGKWIENEGFDGDCYYTCSVCHCDWTTIDGTPTENNMRYCPECGAKMDLEE